MTSTNVEAESIAEYHIFKPQNINEEVAALRHIMIEQVKSLGPRDLLNPDDEFIAKEITGNLLLTTPTVMWGKARVSEPILVRTQLPHAQLKGFSRAAKTTEDHERVWITIPFEGSAEVFLMDPDSNRSTYRQPEQPSFRWKTDSTSHSSGDGELVLEVRVAKGLSISFIKEEFAGFHKIVTTQLNEVRPILENEKRCAESEVLELVRSRRARYKHMRSLRDELRQGDFELGHFV